MTRKMFTQSYSVGDLIRKLNKKIYAGECIKLQPVYVGPCVIVNVHRWTTVGSQ